MSKISLHGRTSVLRSAALLCFFIAELSSCTLYRKKNEPIAEPVRVKRDEFVLRKPLNLKCNAADEFITTMQYLRNESDLDLNPADAAKLSAEVSSGCSGAAKRFIINTDMLRQSGMDARSAMKFGKRLAVTDEAAAAAFTKVFRLAFERFHLDLDFASAVRLAESLSVDFLGDPSIAAADFDKIVTFCTRRSGLDMSKPNCGNLAAKVARMGSEMTAENSSDKSSAMNDGLAGMFIETFEFLTERGGPGLTSTDALRISESLAVAGPTALENFKDVYAYATARGGLNLPRGESVNLAAKVAANSRNRALNSGI